MNVDTEIDRIREWIQGDKAYPTKVDIFPTQKCNLNCKFCEFGRRGLCDKKPS